mmetsp:Transcript_34281/g.87051  ORF Transcript_34281/g.87051 Transcript_34281/m.87051 type:complete len:357 (-) Transcript_34281:1133-2203(-)
MKLGGVSQWRACGIELGGTSSGTHNAKEVAMAGSDSPGICAKLKSCRETGPESKLEVLDLDSVSAVSTLDLLSRDQIPPVDLIADLGPRPRGDQAWTDLCGRNAQVEGLFHLCSGSGHAPHAEAQHGPVEKPATGPSADVDTGVPLQRLPVCGHTGRRAVQEDAHLPRFGIVDEGHMRPAVRLERAGAMEVIGVEAQMRPATPDDEVQAAAGAETILLSQDRLVAADGIQFHPGLHREAAPSKQLSSAAKAPHMVIAEDQACPHVLRLATRLAVAPLELVGVRTRDHAAGAHKAAAHCPACRTAGHRGSARVPVLRPVVPVSPLRIARVPLRRFARAARRCPAVYDGKMRGRRLQG